MVKVEEQFMIREAFRDGMSISEIARLTGHDRKTIREIVTAEGPRQPQERVRESRLDPFKVYLRGRFHHGVFNCAVLLDEIRKQGYPGEISILRDFVRPFRQARRREIEATVRFETAPGRQAQVDWAHFGTIWHEGRRRKLYVFIYTLGYSRAMYLEFTVSQQMEVFLRCHLHAFHYLGGVPAELLYDNQKMVVLHHDPAGNHHWNAKLLDFAGCYGFDPRLCRPYRARTKGKVESGVAYVRGNFWVRLLTVTGLDDLNTQAWNWLEETANARVHGTTGEVPRARLATEPLRSITGRPDYDTAIVGHRQVTRDCFISYEGVRYSAPASCCGQKVLVRETPEGVLEIWAENQRVAVHRLAPKGSAPVVEPAHHAELWAALRRAPLTLDEVVLGVQTAATPELEVEVRTLAEYEVLAGGER
jgi:transposase